MDLIVTTVQNKTPLAENLAKEVADKLQIPLVQRGKLSINAIKNIHKVSNVIIATNNGPLVNTPGGEFFFHLSMAELRIKNIINGKHDHMIAAMELLPGMSVLDCTLGLATDAIVASFAAGTTGMIIGIETSPAIAFIIAYGLKHFVSDNEEITAALRRITVNNSDCLDFLSKMPDKSVDIVFLDPMFRQPIYSSSNLKPLRYLSDNRPLNLQIIAKACRVARKKVVVKESSASNELTRLGINTIVGGKYSSVCYGVIEVENK